MSPRQPLPALPTYPQARNSCAAARAPLEPVQTTPNRTAHRCSTHPTHAAHSRDEPEEPRGDAEASQTHPATLESRPQRVRNARECQVPELCTPQHRSTPRRAWRAAQIRRRTEVRADVPITTTRNRRGARLTG